MCLQNLAVFSSSFHIKSFKNRLIICQIKKYLILRFIGRKMNKVKKFLRLDPGRKKYIYK